MVANPTYMSENEFTDYLAKHNIGDYKKKNDEISFPCPFDVACDGDHKGNEEYHCNFNLTNCTYHCFKCGASGNYLTLLRHFGDYEEYNEKQKLKKEPTNSRRQTSLETTVRNIHKKSRKDIQEYFNGRGINSNSIDKYMLGLGTLGGHHGFIIPILDRDGKIAYVKIRRRPEDESAETIAETMNQKSSFQKYIVYPAGVSLALVGEDQILKSTSSDVLICEGELDRIIAIQEGIKMPVVCGGGGAQTFKDEWIDALKNMRNIYISLDRDKAGEDGFEKLAGKITERIPTASIYKVTLPFDDDSHGDLTDYFVKGCGTADELFSKYSTFYDGAKPIDVSKFREMSIDDVAKILDLTIKDNYENKVIIFLAMLLAYTEDLQLNIIMNAESSSGKTYLVNEVSKLFPEQDVYPYSNASPTAPYYNERFKKVDEHGVEYSDFERKILIFEDQPNPQLLANLRSFLSHDLKKTPFMLTNKGKGGKNTAKEGYLLGFSSVLFCSANLRIDGQEQTRSFILSPENTEETIRASVDACIDRDSDELSYQNWLNSNKERNDLKDRIIYIKNLKVKYIDLCDKKYVRDRFYENLSFVAPGTRRKIKQFIALIKGIALLNASFRATTEGRIMATNEDVDEAVKLWGGVKESMSYGLSPEILNYYKAYILRAFIAKKALNSEAKGITQDELSTYYYDKNGHGPNFDMLKKVYIPTLKREKFIKYERDEENGQRWLIMPLIFFENLDDDLDDDSDLET